MNCSQCKDCAFARKSLANLETDNHLRGILTVCAGTPFYCHEQLNWKRPAHEAQVPKSSPAEMRARLLSITLPGKTPHVCVGWKEAVGELAAANWFRGVSGKMRRRVSALALTTLGELLEMGTVGRRNERRQKRAQMVIKNCLMMLVEDLRLSGIKADRMLPYV